MIESGPSRTALFTSLMRALHSRHDPTPLLDDPWGDRLVPNSERDGFCERILVRMDSEAGRPTSTRLDIGQFPADQCRLSGRRNSITLRGGCAKGSNE